VASIPPVSEAIGSAILTRRKTRREAGGARVVQVHFSDEGRDPSPTEEGHTAAGRALTAYAEAAVLTATPAGSPTPRARRSAEGLALILVRAFSFFDDVGDDIALVSVEDDPGCRKSSKVVERNTPRIMSDAVTPAICGFLELPPQSAAVMHQLRRESVVT
jgi:hypothetical protein